MGFFRRLFGKSGSSPTKIKQKKRWSFAVSSNSNPSQSTKRDGESARFDENNLDSNKHAIAVAAATAAVAEAALAAAQAAAEVVRLTSAGGGGRSAAQSQAAGNRRRLMADLAAVKIQSAFRGYLARRALRALKALVKLQALVRGNIVRKQTSDMLRRMQTLLRLQAQARASRIHLTRSCHSNSKFSRSHHSRGGSVSNYRDIKHIDDSKLGENWLEHWMEESFHNNNNNRSNTPTRYRHEDDKSDKILEIDTWKPHKSSQTIRAFKKPTSDFNPSFSSYNSPSKISSENVSPKFRVVDNSAFSPSSRPGSSGRRGTFTPTKSESSRGYFGHPNYMANTESFRAKLRSQSAPRQRLEFERYGMVNRFAQECYFDADTVSESGFSQHGNSRNRTQQTTRSLSRVRSTNLR